MSDLNSSASSAVLPAVAMNANEQGVDGAGVPLLELGTAIAQATVAVAAGDKEAHIGTAGVDTPVWSDTRPFLVQLGSYPATCFLSVTFFVVFAALWQMRISPGTLGSSYRQVLLRQELWRVLTAAFVHGGVLHLLFNVCTLWGCRRMEAELGSWGYLVASMHILILAEFFEKSFHHLLHRVGVMMDIPTVGYSGVIFGWMAVLALKPDMAPRGVGGMEVGGVLNLFMNLIIIKILHRGSSLVGHLSGIMAGLLFATGGLDFARTRYWGTGLGMWALLALLGSLKATTGIPVPLVDYADFAGRNELGIWIAPFDWDNRQGLEDFALANA